MIQYMFSNALNEHYVARTFYLNDFLIQVLPIISYVEECLCE